LIDAVRASNAKAVHDLLARRADVRSAQRDGTTALHWAVRNDDVAIAAALVKAGANINAVNRYGVGSLHLACVNGNAKMIDLLLAAGADANESLPAGETALMTCARTGNVEAIKRLLDYGADVNAKESWSEQTALMWAAAEKHPDSVKVLLDYGADLQARSKELGGVRVGAEQQRVPTRRISGGFTPFLFAVREGDIPTTHVLLDAGASVKETTPDGTCALVLAILNAHFELASLLLDKGADPNVEDARHGSALHTLEWVRRQAPGIGMGSSPIYPRIPTGDMDSLTLAKKLLDMGADPNVQIKLEDPKYAQGEKGQTFYYVSNPPDLSIAVATLNWDGAAPFWVAAKNADVPFMQLLADYGADPTATNRVHVTPLMAAAGAGYMQGEHPGSEAEALAATKLALELGNDVNAVADFGPGEDRADLRFSGLTALHGAAQRGANSIVQFLVEKGAKIDVTTRNRWTPFNIADGIQIGGTLKNSPETAALLRKLMTERGIEVKEQHYEDEFAKAGGGK
jgi:ankyrin